MLKEEIKNIAEDKSALKKFGVTVGGVLILISVILYLLEKDLSFYIGSIGVLLFLIGLIYPVILKPLNKIWMTGAIILGWVISRLILILLYYIVVTPLGIVLKIIGKDFLKLNFDKTSKSYWELRIKRSSEKSDYEKQF